MKATFVLLASAWMAGGDAALVQTSCSTPGCSSGCAVEVSSCDCAAPAKSKKSFGGLFSGWGKKKKAETVECGCEPVATCGSGCEVTPAPVVVSECATCDPCATNEPKAKKHWGGGWGKKADDCGCESSKSGGLFSFFGKKKKAEVVECGCEPVSSCGSGCDSAPVVSTPAPIYHAPAPAPVYHAPAHTPAPVYQAPAAPAHPQAPSYSPPAAMPTGPSVPATMPKNPEPPATMPKNPMKGVEQPPAKDEKKEISIPSQPAASLPVSTPKVEDIKNPFDLDRRYEARAERATDFSWLKGQLFFVHADGGVWVLRYAPLDREDANGGSVVLARGLQMDNYREGDLVKIHGEIIQTRASRNLGGPLYKVQSIELVDRPAAAE